MRTGLVAAAVIALAGVLVLVASPWRDGNGSSAQSIDGDGVVVRLPDIGTLRWSCEGTSASPRFRTRLVLPEVGASVFVWVTSDGAPVARNRQIDPRFEGKGGVAGPYTARRRQTWRITYHHKPASFDVRVRLRFAGPPDVQCMVSRPLVDIRREVR